MALDSTGVAVSLRIYLEQTRPPVPKLCFGSVLVASRAASNRFSGNLDAVLQCTPSLDNLRLAPDSVVDCEAVYKVCSRNLQPTVCRTFDVTNLPVVDYVEPCTGYSRAELTTETEQGSPRISTLYLPTNL